jgi:hypothetical protein
VSNASNSAMRMNEMYDWNTITSKIDSKHFTLIAAFYVNSTQEYVLFAMDKSDSEFVVWNLVPSIENPDNDFVGHGFYSEDGREINEEIMRRIDGNRYVSILSA